jgi:DNA processing protein
LDISGEQEQILALLAGMLGRTARQEVLNRVLAGASFARAVITDAGDDILQGVRHRIHEVEAALARCAELQLGVIPLSSPRYPALLRASSSPPVALYVRGAGLAQGGFPESTVAIVGSRNASVEACHHISLIAREIAAAGVTVVSGLALGIDGAAHRGALEAQSACPTIAVMAHGLDTVYPRSHHLLAHTILQRGGALVSEYAPGVQPLQHQFLDRNRIIAALSRGVVVAQAGERSGSLVTATYAGDYGRDVFVVVDGAEDERTQGCRRLIEDGAIPVQRASEILAEYGVPGTEGGRMSPPDDVWETVTKEQVQELAGGSFERALNWELEGQLVWLSGNRVLIRGRLRRERG